MTLAHGLRILAQAFDRLSIPFALGGSMASSARGVPRSTRDVDFIADLPIAKVGPLAKFLGPDWYADEETMRDAISRQRSFNLIYIPASYKYDVFPAQGDFGRQQLERSTLVDMEIEGEVVPCPVTSAEDIFLAKLSWLKSLGGTSDRQESDLSGLVDTNPDLDWLYVEAWATKLGTAKLLERFRLQ